MSDDFEYRAFISYSHRDRKTADWLHKVLESYRAPARLRGAQDYPNAIPRRIGKVFKDREELSASGSLTDAVEAALRSSRYLIVICSPAAASSPWVNDEIRRYKAFRGEKYVLPLIVSGQPHALDPDLECFPEALRYRVDSDGALTDEVTEPIASDLRVDGRKRAKLKIVSTLLGVKLDDLLQREHQRQVARLAVITTASIVGLVLTTALAVLAYTARLESEWQRGKAESLIEFMLTDLREKLEPVGRLDVLDAVGREALEYYASLPRDSLDDESLSRSSRALILIGEVKNLRGDLEDAKLIFEQSYRTTEELLSRSEGDPQRLYDHAQSAFWLGYLDWQRGNAAGAREAFLEYESLAERLVAVDPEKQEWIAELGHARRNLGVLLLESGSFEDAERVFRLSLEGFRKIADANADNLSWQLELGQGYAWLADSLLEQRRFDDARNARTRELEIYESMLAQDERNNQVSDKIVVTYRHLGELALASGQTREARRFLELGVSRSRWLLDWDPDNTLWKEFACGALLDLAALAMIEGDSFPDAIVSEAMGIAEELNQRDPDVLAWRVQMLARAQLYAAVALPPEQRRGELNRIIETLTADAERNPLEVRSWLAVAYQTRARYGDPADAGSDWLWLTQTLGDDENLAASTEVILAEALIRTGAGARAKDIIEDLQRVGYAHPDLRVIASLARN